MFEFVFLVLVFGVFFFNVFFSPSANESPLSLLRFKLTEISICSVFSSLFFIVVDDDDDGFVVTVVTVVAVVVELAVIWFSVDAIADFFEGVFFFSLLVTWIHPSSSLSGWSPVSGLGLPLVDCTVFIVTAAAIVVIVVVVVGGGVVILVVF